MPLVSVIMPAYNVESYLADAARSVLRQTFTDFQLIIVNDGSTDRTGEIADEMKRIDPGRVVVVTQPNRGLSAARNTALAVATGDLFALLDSDDVWEPEFLESQVAVLAANPDVDLVTGNGRSLGGARQGRLVHPFPDERPPITLATIISDEEAVFVMTLFRRRVRDAIGDFDETPGISEDFDYWLRAALAGFRFARNDAPLAWYRRRDDSISADAVRALNRALRVCAKMHPLLAGRPERALLEEKIAYYEAELDVATARRALSNGDAPMAATALASLHNRRPSIRTAVAALLARHAAPLLVALYQFRLRTRQA